MFFIKNLAKTLVLEEKSAKNHELSHFVSQKQLKTQCFSWKILPKPRFWKKTSPASPAQAGALGHPLGTYVGRLFGELPPSPGPLFGALFGPPRGRFGTPRGVEKGGFWGVLGSFPGRVIFGTPHR